MAKKSKDGMTAAERLAFHRNYRKLCPKESCGGLTCLCQFTWGAYYECDDCGKKFGYVDGRGSSVTKQKYDVLAERGRTRPVKGAGMSCPKEEDEMAKVKKAKKKKVAKKSKAVKKGAPAKKGPSVCAFVREFAAKNEKATVEDIAKALDKKHPGLTYSLATVKAQAYRARKGLDASGRTQ